MSTLTVLPPMPVHPPVYAALAVRHNEASRTLRLTIRAYTRGKADWAQVKAARDLLMVLRAEVTQWSGTVEGLAYMAEVDAYEAARQARIAERAAEAQATTNRAAAAVVRSGACTRCFTTHPGEC